MYTLVAGERIIKVFRRTVFFIDSFVRDVLVGVWVSMTYITRGGVLVMDSRCSGIDRLTYSSLHFHTVTGQVVSQACASVVKQYYLAVAAKDSPPLDNI